MKKHTLSRLFNSVLLITLILSAVLPASPALAQEPDPESIPTDELIAAPDPSGPEVNPLYPVDIDPPESCDVPGKAPFGEDVEILLGPLYGYDTYRLNQNASWGGETHLSVPCTSGMVNAKSSNNVAAVAIGADRIVAVWKEDYYVGYPVYSIWNAGAGWSQGGILYVDGPEPQVKGNPAILSRQPKNWVAFVRDDDDFIQYREWNDGAFGSWQTVPGNYDARSDPAVLSKDPSHMVVFFQDSDGTIKFNEWTGGVGWRSEPVSLGKPSGTTFSSELSVVSRNENHIAVFGMTSSNQLWVKEWTNYNESDWNDTEWVYLMGGYSHFKPAVVSRHTNHMGVAVVTWTGSGVGARYKEWTYQSGWKASVDLPITGTDFWSPLTLAATSTDEMWLFGVSVDGRLRRNRWSEDGGWSGWAWIHSGWKASSAAHNWTVAAVVRRPYDVMVIGRESDNEVISTHRTSQNQTVSKQYQENGRYGTPRAQTIAMVDGKPIWVTVWRSTVGNWKMQASQTSLNWSVYSRQKNLDHADSGSSGQANGMRSIATADMDGDGDDEVVVATMRRDGTRIDISVVELGVTSSSINITSDKTSHSNLPIGLDVNVAVGDLDGDGLDNEVVVGYRRLSPGTSVRTLLYQYTDGSLQFQETKDWTFGPGSLSDVEIAIGKVRRSAGEQLVIAVQGSSMMGCLYDGYVGIYDWRKDQRGDRTLYEISKGWTMYGGAGGEYSTALATGDVDADGLEEIIYTYGSYIQAIDGDYRPDQILLHPMYEVGKNGGKRSLAVGDLDWDGKAEIVYGYKYSSGSGYVWVIEKTDTGSLISTGIVSAQGVPLVADLDDDSHEANLAGCKTFREVSVIAVVNGAPRHYSGGTPAHTTSGGVANSSSTSSGAEDGWHVNLGESVSVGFSAEQAIPIFGTKIAEVRGKVTAELMSSRMGSTRSYASTTETTGYTFGVGESGYALGMVVYDEATYKCDYYDVYKPDAPADTSRAMACTPTSNPIQTHTTVDRWHSKDFKNEATGSWADVGRDSNDVTLYPSANPIDAYLVKWEGSELLVHESSGGLYTTWSIDESSGEDKITGATWDVNAIVSAGATIGVVTVDASITAGYGQQWSRSTGWEESLCIQGKVEHFKETDCPGCPDYRVVPYVYQATALSEAGATYPYLEADYYVPCIGCAASAEAEAPKTIVGLAPQAPVITSTTHLDPATWYPTSTVTFDWVQPAGDPAVVAGYRWNVDDTETITPTSLVPVLTQTHTYEGVPDGLYYLHMQAMGDGGDYSEVAHRAVRVDVNPPQVEFALDPMVSTGLYGWYNSPMTVTVNATDTTGSGVNAVEYRVDSGAWQTYTTPIAFLTDTLTTTLWARATDDVGHTSDPISATLRLDLTPPSSYDLDGNRLTYASIITDDVGNLQLVLGGALSDTLSGRLMMEVKVSETTPWHPVSAVGEFPIPPDNWLVTTDTTSLNWIYTPTYEIRGVYPLRGRGLDRAGNYEVFEDEKLEIFGIFWWEPDDVPDLAESLVSVAPREVYPGSVVTFTLGVRNTGYQEAQIALTDTVPAELTILTDTISGGGQYDADSGAITWTLHALWPGETRYLFFSAQVDAGLTLTESLPLENRLDVRGYWPWGEEMPEIQPYLPPKPESHFQVATTTLTVLTGTTTSASPPYIMAAEVWEGKVVDDPQVTIFVDASPDAEFIYVKEWVWDTISDTWTLAQESGWVSFEEADGFEVSENAFSKQGRYQWMLSEGDGVKYLGVWVADADQQTTNLNDANLIYTNLMGSGGQTLDAGERVQYRVPLQANDLTIFNLVTLSGDADLYIWKPRFAFRPHYYSNADETGFHIDTVGFFAEEEGVHVVEVEAASDGTYYRLVTAGDMPSVGLLAETRAVLTSDQMAILETQDEAMRTAYETLPRSVHLPLQEKERPAHPLSLSTPYRLGDTGVLPDVPKVPEELTEYTVYLPLVLRSE